MNQRRKQGKEGRRAAAPPRRGVSDSGAEKYEQVFEKIYRLVLKIPRGRVMTYGQIARLLEDRYSPRLVGWAMHATPSDGRNIPWHRVINSKGGISTGRLILHEPDLQRLLLEAEDVLFDERGRCDLRVYQWSPRQRKSAAGDKPESITRASNRKVVTTKAGSAGKAGAGTKKR